MESYATAFFDLLPRTEIYVAALRIPCRLLPARKARVLRLAPAHDRRKSRM
jgi:hypothetical protein